MFFLRVIFATQFNVCDPALFLLEGSSFKLYIKSMKNKNDWSIKSVGYNIEGGGYILDDREWSREWDEYWEEGESVSFENGLNDLKKYVIEDNGESVDGKKKWVEIEKMLREIKEEVGNRGDWRLWGVEYDWSFGVELCRSI